MTSKTTVAALAVPLFFWFNISVQAQQYTASVKHYGPEHGARLARKHIGWYAERHLQPEAARALRQAGNSLHTTRDQCRQLSALWARLQPSEEDAA